MFNYNCSKLQNSSISSSQSYTHVSSMHGSSMEVDFVNDNEPKTLDDLRDNAKVTSHFD